MAEFTKDELLDRFTRGKSLERADLSNLRLEGVSLVGANLTRADLSGANLAGADLSDAVLVNASLPEAFLQSADLAGAILRNADLDGANLVGAAMEGADLSRANLEGANLEAANLIRARLHHALLADASLGKADLTGANLRSADLSDAYFGGARLAGADLRKATLDGANFEEADLIEADLRGCELHSATLTGAILEGAKVFGISVDPSQIEAALVEWWDVSRSGDGSQREEGEEVGTFLRPPAETRAVSETAAAPATPGARFFGEGDILKNAELEFSSGSQVEVRGRFENCSITLGDGAELEVGDSGLLRNCAIIGGGIVRIHGRMLNHSGDTPTTCSVFFVGAGGTAVGTVVQPPGLTRFGFETGCSLRLKIRA